MKHLTTTAAAGAAVTLILVSPAPTYASGLALRETDAISLGNAYVGGVSRASDGATVVLNPAGMSLLESSELYGNVFYVGPSARFSGQNYLAPGVKTSGNQGGKNINSAATASSFGVWKINNRLAVGYGFTAPYGLRMDYPQNWVGRYQSLVTTITDYELSLAASYRVTKKLSIGLGPRLDFLSGRFTQAANLGALNQYGTTTADLSGNGFGFGYSAGLIYKFDDRTQIGITYRSRVSIPVAIKTKFAPPWSLAANPFVQGLLVAESGHGKLQVTLPDSVGFGFTHRVTPKLTVMMQGEWTHWSLLQQLNAISDHGGLNTSIPINWRNTWFGGIAVNYALRKNILLRSGFSYDQSPVNAKNRQTRTPDSDRFNLSAGIEYSPIKMVSLDLSYAHLFAPGGSINSDAGNNAGQLVGNYSTHANVVGFGMRTHF
ncbi:OmpP1/FadL family transporter [Acetobacter sp. DsW_063]|uniref:OmpP1/FadL family transporter n=1 Tax=Acetobacter sp. DsW_063 TaxID=1514894 RepID=UPI000B70C9E2|nr:outer membrane protein transport protein [Acetobacter sp. DsW_063]OUJ12576.1 hypothetical protein HK28_03390 [Acetobacter sp. DsW_063]